SASPMARITRRGPGGRPVGSGGGGSGSPRHGGASLAEYVRRNSARAPSSSDDGPPAPVTSAHIPSTPAPTINPPSPRHLPPPASGAARRIRPDAEMSLYPPRSSRRR